MDSSRRTYLCLLGTVGTSISAGCLGAATQARDASNRGRPVGEGGLGTEGTDAKPTEDTSRNRPVRCEGTPISVERTITEDSEYGDGVEYHPSNETVRFVSSRSGSGQPEYDTMSFEAWGAVTSARVGRSPVSREAASRIDSVTIDSAIGRPPASASVDRPVIWLETDVSDEARSAPAVETIADSAPRSAGVTLSFEGETFSRDVPVFARAIDPEIT